MRIPQFLFFALLTGVLLLAGQVAAMLSAGLERTVGVQAARAAAMWFETGTGWGGDDTVLDAILASGRLRGYVRELARAQRAAGMVASRVLFLDEIVSAVD